MSALSYTLVLVSVCISACAQVALKLGATSLKVGSIGEPMDLSGWLLGLITNTMVLIGLGLYGVGMVLWLSVLARVELSRAYPFVGIGFILTAILGATIFHETITPLRAVGIVVIIGGTVLVARS